MRNARLIHHPRSRNNVAPPFSLFFSRCRGLAPRIVCRVLRIIAMLLAWYSRIAARVPRDELVWSDVSHFPMLLNGNGIFILPYESCLCFVESRTQVRVLVWSSNDRAALNINCSNLDPNKIPPHPNGFRVLKHILLISSREILTAKFVFTSYLILVEPQYNLLRGHTGLERGSQCAPCSFSERWDKMNGHV
jgi:hypothetical protein